MIEKLVKNHPATSCWPPGSKLIAPEMAVYSHIIGYKQPIYNQFMDWL